MFLVRDSMFCVRKSKPAEGGGESKNGFPLPSGAL
jgi:hypothetical protein